MADLPHYTFVPWLRRGVSAEIEALDHLGEQPLAGPTGRATLPVELVLDTVAVPGAPAGASPTLRRDVAILSPGDVGAIKAEAILRTDPADGALAATPGDFAFVEFYEEDFPWRYTPARAADATAAEDVRFKLRPWIALFVLTEAEFTLREQAGGLAVLTLAEDVDLPPRTETWAWAHAQISQQVATATAVDAAVVASPDLALSRLLCPRRLEPATSYHAFLVPAFESGRLAGLGLDASAAGVQQPAWGTAVADADRRYPVYHRFAFTTSSSGDFETLARKLTPAPVGQEFGRRTLDVSDPAFGMTPRPGATVALEGALQPPDFARTAFPASPGPAVTSELESIVDLGERQRAETLPDDPIVVPPAYGRRHAGVVRVADAAGSSDLAWLAELNLDPRSRAAAGLGAEVVRGRQEELMQRAWEQVGRLQDANQRLREAELARTVTQGLFAKHLVATPDADQLLILTSSAHAGVPAEGVATSVRGTIDASRVPAAAQAPAFRRITRPQRPLMRRITGGGGVGAFQPGLITRMNEEPEQALSAAPPMPDPIGSMALALVADAVQASIDQLAAQAAEPDRIFLELAQADLAARLAATPSEDIGALAPAALRRALVAALDVRIPPGSPPEDLAIGTRVRALIDAVVAVEPERVDTAIVTLGQAAFAAEYGEEVAGKSYGGVTVVGDAPPPGTDVARATALLDVQQYATALAAFGTDVVAARPAPLPAPALAAPPTVAAQVLGRLDPHVTVQDRVLFAVPGLAASVDARPAVDPRRLRPVLAYPRFRDPLVLALAALSQDHVLPNVAALPRDSLTLMEPNPRFIESYLAGANHAFAQELLWREYPTDQRGTSFQVFWDTRDALDDPGRTDIVPMHRWAGALGAQSPLPPAVLVLVVRGELLLKYPSTVIYAQEAEWPGTDFDAPRQLAADGEVRHPIFHARLAPDVTIVGFDLDEDEARGHRPRLGDPRPAAPGWFFVLMERPGEPHFGLDEAEPPEGLRTWNDLAWDSLTMPAGSTHVRISPNAGLAPSIPQTAAWGRSSGDMASILFQSPVLLARHASEMLP